VTIDEEGMLRSCPMQTLELDAEGRVWFFTSASSPKVKETHAHAYWVNLRYGDPDKQNYLSLSGTAHIEHDRAKMEELYTPWVKFWHSQGLDDPDVAL
jgi:general stress protein 26